MNKTSQATIRKRRRWLYAIVSITIVPFLLFLGMGLGLHLAGFGYPSNYFIKKRNNKTFLSNQRFGWRFFSPQMARNPFKVYSHFERNLTDIMSTARDSGSEIIVCIVATNLEDNAPFASMQKKGKHADQKKTQQIHAVRTTMTSLHSFKNFGSSKNQKLLMASLIIRPQPWKSRDWALSSYKAGWQPWT